MTHWSIALAGWLLFAFWGVLLLPLWPASFLWWLRRLARQVAPPEDWPRVSIIVAARDEQSQIEAALTSLLALDYPSFEVIAVNDRSTDQTGAIIDRAAQSDSRLTAVHISDLPAGWLGKNHAMHFAAGRATGELLLFTDGDVIFAPEALKLAVTWLVRKPLDHLCLNPRLVPGGYWENALTSCFALLFSANVQPWLIPTRVPFAYCGIGAFNLVRSDAYRAVGGHTRIRLDVLDDVLLGRLIKQAGYRQQLVQSGNLISVRWQNSFWGVIRGLEKNAFASVRYSLWRLCGVTALMLVVMFGPYVGLALWPAAAVAPFVLTVVLLHATYANTARSIGAGVTVLPVLPLMFACFIYMLWRSALITLRQGGIRWRDTFYSLDELRANQFLGQASVANPHPGAASHQPGS
jgi:cellulose synthase/poly-beta-1,6-N-acetylglucosamine synthase-like glycosyltransferase